MTAPHGCPGCTCPVATDPAAFHDDDCASVTADEAAPTPDVPDEAVRAGADGFMRAEREPMYHPSEGPPLQSTQDVAHAVLEGVLADLAARAALLAALGHTDCVSRAAFEMNQYAMRLAHQRGNDERDRAERAERNHTRSARRVHAAETARGKAEAERDRYRDAHDALLDRAREVIAAWWEGHGDLDQALADLKQTVHAITDRRAALDGEGDS